MPVGILNKARELRSKAQDVNMEAILTKLNTQSKQMDEEQVELEQRLQRVRKLEDDLRREKDKVSSKRQDIVDSSRRDAMELKRKLRIEAESIIRELKQQFRETTDREKAKAIEQARRSIQQISLPDKEKTKRNPIDVKTLQIGQRVFINSLDGLGTVMSIKGKKLTVSVKGMTVRVENKDISAPYYDEIKQEQREEKKAAAVSSYRPIRIDAVAAEINVIGKTGSEAIPEVEKFLDQALAAGFSPVRIIHAADTTETISLKNFDDLWIFLNSFNNTRILRNNWHVIVLCLLAAVCFIVVQPVSAGSQDIRVIAIEGEINAGQVALVRRGLTDAQEQGDHDYVFKKEYRCDNRFGVRIADY